MAALEEFRGVAINVMPWCLSLLTIWMMVSAGDRRRGAWLIGLTNNGLWLIWVLLTESWGLLPMNAALWFVYARNYLRWSAS